MSREKKSSDLEGGRDLNRPSDADNDGKLGSADPDSIPPKVIKPSKRSILVIFLLIFSSVLLILKVWSIGPFNTSIEKTDNAYVRGKMTVLSPQVSGYISEVLVDDFQYVEANQPLIRIDDRIYSQKVFQAQAELDIALAELATLEQTLAQNEANLMAQKAALVSAQAEAKRAQTDRKRADELAQKGSISIRERDQAIATAELGSGNVLQANASIAIATEAIKATEISRASLEARVEAAQAAWALAHIDLDNTVVRAPVSGQVSEASVRLGQYVTAGTQLLFLVPETRWVIANFKETQTSTMQVGQVAQFTVDGLDGKVFLGRIESIAPATGSEFSVLRADNASGNFTKVVQRLPVRIGIDAGQDGSERLRPGMSVVAEIDTSTAVKEEDPQESDV